MNVRLITVIVILAAATVSAAAPARTLIHAGTLLAVPGEGVKTEATVVVAGSRITSIENGFVQAQPGDRLIDLTCCFVLPGLIDLHVHLTSPVTGGGRLRVVTDGPAELALRAAEYGRRTLEAGFTTVLDLGTARRAHEQAIFAYREATANHRLPGPRVVAVGSPLSPTGFSRTAAYRPEVEAVVGPQAVCDGPDACRRAVREQVRRGADIISFYNSGSLLDERIVEQTFTIEEMRAIVDTAHALGRRVIADGHTARGVNAALRAGVDIVDTMPWPDEETWRLLKETGAYFVPHLYAFEVSVRAPEDDPGADPLAWMAAPIRDRLLGVMRQPYSAELAYERDVPLAFGSDTGVVEHGDNAGEFGELVKVGLSPTEAIVTATVNAADALGLGDRIGSLKPGRSADIIAVETSPLSDIERLRNVRFVMREGVVYLDGR